MTHSPEPWRIVPREPSGAAPIILDANGEIVELEPHNEDWTIANWPRIVACVNACRGIRDELLPDLAILGDAPMASLLEKYLNDARDRSTGNKELMQGTPPNGYEMFGIPAMTNDGGPAFPGNLRDWFAGMAMQGTLANEP